MHVVESKISEHSHVLLLLIATNELYCYSNSSWIAIETLTLFDDAVLISHIYFVTEHLSYSVASYRIISEFQLLTP